MARVRIPEMQIVSCNTDAIDRIKCAPRKDASEHLAVRQHNSAAVRKVGFDPSANHRQQPLVAFVIGQRKGGKAAGMAVDLITDSPSAAARSSILAI